MDVLLEQPLEAVAFRAYFLPEVAAAAGAGAAAWTCLAAVLAAAAAAGLWRLRSSAPHAVAHAVKPMDLEHRSAPTPRDPAERTKETSALPESTSSSAPAPLTPRERYTAYYHYDGGCVGCCDVEGDDDDEEDHHQEDLEDDDDVVYGTPPSETDPFDWQQVVMSLPLEATTTKTALETGRCRSPRALGGSVVRLWDQGAEAGLTAAAASPRRRRGIVVAGVGTVSPF